MANSLGFNPASVFFMSLIGGAGAHLLMPDANPGIVVGCMFVAAVAIGSFLRPISRQSGERIDDLLYSSALGGGWMVGYGVILLLA